MLPAEQSAKAVRCATYTRTSSEEGLSQEFNSLDAQRECGEAYIRSQRQAGWTLRRGGGAGSAKHPAVSGRRGAPASVG